MTQKKKSQPSPEKTVTIQSVNPRVDIAFKKIFGVEENKDLLISLINSIVSQEDQIRDVRILNPYNLQNFKKDKLSILDIKAEGHNKKRYHIEIQISDEGDYDKRALHNWAKVYTEQLASSNDYKLLNKTIGIHILNFLSIPGSGKYHNVFHLKEKDSDFRFFADMELHTIELRKFEEKKKESKKEEREGSTTSKHILDCNEELRNLLSKIKTALDIWVAFLTRHDLLDKAKLPSEIDNPSLRKALNVIEVMNLSPEERAAYESHLDWLRMEVSTVGKAQAEARAEGEAIGEARGIEIGAAKGEARGLAKGKLEEKIANVVGLVKAGVDDKIICKAMDISADQLAQLKQQHGL